MMDTGKEMLLQQGGVAIVDHYYHIIPCQLLNLNHVLSTSK